MRLVGRASGKRGIDIILGEKLILFQQAMHCPLCSHEKTYKHGKTSSGSQRYRCLNCKQTFTNSFDTIYYRRQVTEEEVRIVLQSHCEGTSLRGISRKARTILQHRSELDSNGKSKSPTGS